MTCSDRLSQWSQTVSSYFPHLSRPQARVLALWSVGMLLADSCGITQITTLLALLLDCREGSLRQRLREWLYDASDKKGAHREQIEVQSCFGPLLSWVLDLWQGERQLALALDATTLGQRFTVLCVSVLIGGCAIPVAWKVVTYNEKGSWQPYWQQLLHALEGRVPVDWQVIVLADRGLYAPWLFRQIVALGWHPFLRINLAAKACRKGEASFEWIQSWLPARGEQWSEEVDCFVQKKGRLQCTLVLFQAEGYEEPWVIVTDLPPHQVRAVWYRMRCWIEGGFKDYKRGGWGWHHTKMGDVKRVERLWLAMAVATLWAVSLGSQAERTRPCSQLETLPPHHVARQRAGSGKAESRGRGLSWLNRGRLALLAWALKDEPLPQPHLWAEPWPQTVPSARKVSAATQHKRQKQQQREQHKRRRRKAKQRQRKQRSVA
jgi:DDE family transposase